MEWKEILSEIGEGGTKLVNDLVSSISNQLGLDPSIFQTKILNLIILSLFLILSFKVAQKSTKIILIILLGIFIASTIISIFPG